MKNNVPKKMIIATVIAGSLIAGTLSYKLSGWKIPKVNNGFKQISAESKLLTLEQVTNSDEEFLEPYVETFEIANEMRNA